MRISKGLKQAYDVQDLAYSTMMKMKSQVEQSSIPITREDAQAISALVKAWDAAQERIRLHRRVPLPGSLRPEKKSKKPRAIGVIHPMPDAHGDQQDQPAGEQAS